MKMKHPNRNIIDVLTKLYEKGNYLKYFSMKQNGSIETTFSMHGYEYQCTMILDETKEIKEKHCTCTWMKEYHDCPHCKLTYEKAIGYNITDIPITYENPYHEYLIKEIGTYQDRLYIRKLDESATNSKTLIAYFKKSYEESMKLHLQVAKYEIEPVFSNKYHAWELSFKVGNEKRYVIKSIYQFLKQVDEHKLVSYGKNLSFIHSEDVFDDFSKKQIQFIRKHLQIHKLQQYGSRSKEEGFARFFELKGRILDEFYDLYKDETDLSFDLVETQYSIKIEVEKKEGYYIYKMESNEEIQYGEKHLYVCDSEHKDARIQRITLDDEGITAQFLIALSKQDIVIKTEDYQDFYKYIILSAMQYIDIDHYVVEGIESMDRAELYGDINEHHKIYFYLYCYNGMNQRFQGFDNKRMISYQQDLIESYIRKYASKIDEEQHIVYMNIDDASTLEFISEGLPYLHTYCEIFVSEALKNIGRAQQYRIQINVRYKNDLLTLDIHSGDITKEEIADVMASYKKKKKFHRLKNGKLLSLVSNELEELSELLNEYHLTYKDIQKGRVILDSYRMFALEQKVEQVKYIKIKREDTFKNYLNSYHEVKKHKLPKHYQTILRNYQKDGFEWLSDLRQFNFHGILADDMGLGKTLQVIALLEANQSSNCSIVITPSSLLYNWDDEVHKFSKKLHARCVTGNQEERKACIQNHQDVDLLITSYDYLRRDIDVYERLRFDTIILDEAQNIKNQNTKNAISVKKLQGMHRIALSGTPIENSLSELWSIFDFLMPNYLFNYHYFQKRFEQNIVKHKDEQAQLALQKLVSPFILRRTKKDVLKELPEKIEHVRMIEFSQEERKLYLANLSQVNKDIQKMLTLDGQNKMTILTMLTRLRQLCCEPRLLHNDIDQLSSKLSTCLELLTGFHDTKQKVLLFSSFTSILDLIAEELKRKQISFYLLTGKTSKEDRKELVSKFQTDQTTVFLISLKAGGTGLNLTAAESVIHFDPWWNQSAQNQATDRAYRIGQNKNVQVFKLIMKDSIEEKIMNLQNMKKELADTFIEENEGSITIMNKKDLLALFNIE